MNRQRWWRRRWRWCCTAACATGALAALFLAATPAATPPPPASTSNNFRFAILGDRTGGAQPGIYGRVWREVDLLGPDFVINVGDSIDSVSAADAAREWRALEAIWRRYGNPPLFLVPGNHDLFSEAARQLFERASGHPAFYGFDWQNAHFTVLDNSAGFELSDPQLEFLERDLAAHCAADPKFVFFHKPFWLVPLKLASGDFKLHALARKYGVGYVVSGHGHQLLRLERDGVTYVEVGSSGAGFHSLAKGQGFEQGWFYHFLWGRVTGSRVALTVKELSPPAGQGRMFPIEQWGEPGPMFPAADPAEDPET